MPDLFSLSFNLKESYITNKWNYQIKGKHIFITVEFSDPYKIVAGVDTVNINIFDTYLFTNVAGKSLT